MLLPIALATALFCLLPAAANGACSGDTVPCDDGECVRREDWCDKNENCEDGSDEAYCRKAWWGISYHECNEKIHFRCGDGICWPLTARCDGIEDCKDGSDEAKCDTEEKKSDEIDYPDEKNEETDKEEKSEETKNEDEENEPKVSSEETKNKDEEDEPKESSEEEETGVRKETSEENGAQKESSEENLTQKESSEENGAQKESSEENGAQKESSEENGSDEVTTKTPSTTTSSDEYDDYDYTTEAVPQETITHIPQPKVDDFFQPKVTSPAVHFSSTTQMDFYANRMKQQYSTQISTRPNRAYHQPAKNPYRTTRNPAVPYTGPTRPYTPRPYRYIGAQHSGQPPSPYRGRYQPANRPYHLSNGNYINPQIRTNHRQQYRSLNYDNGPADWRNGVTRPPRVYGRQLRAPSSFYFKKDYNEIYGRTNYPSVRRGVEWILSIRNATGGWGKETPRALVALSLVNNSFLAGSHENDLMQKYFQVHLGVNLLRDEPVSLNRLAMFVNALIATCQDPRDFQGWDITELIRNTMLKLYRKSKQPVINPLVYLSLCLADRNLTNYEARHLMTYLVSNRNDEVTRDMTSLALEAFACHMQKEKHDVSQFYSHQKLVWNATSRMLQRRREDGSFGSVYSTALAAKALMSLNDTVEWNPEPTFRFLKSHQQRNGSFGDFLATYHVLPALSGRSLLHLRNTHCNPPRVDRELSPQEILQHPGPKSYIRYSLHMGSPLATGNTVQLLVPTGINFFDVMRVAAHENDRFKFSYEEVNGKISVYSISDLPNDPEEGLAWRLYIKNPLDTGNIPNIQELYLGDIRELLPTPDQHFIFWYHPLAY